MKPPFPWSHCANCNTPLHASSNLYGDRRARPDNVLQYSDNSLSFHPDLEARELPAHRVEYTGAEMPAAGTAVKERGCFQCSHRRIICDRTEPSCLKCAKKGIGCSGLGRIRFAKGVARRGRLKDCKIPNREGHGSYQELPTSIRFQALRWPGEEKVKKRKKSAVNDLSSMVSPLEPASDVYAKESLAIIPPSPSKLADSAMEELGRGHDSIMTAHSQRHDIVPWIAPVDSKLRMLFSHFSDVIAPAMVVLDGNMNGYRSLILPMALEDGVLRRAVAVVAAQHLSRQRPELLDAAEAGRAAVISRLHHDSLQQSADQVFNKFTWATLIVLLVGETVTGSADYRFIVQMLLSLSVSNPGRDANPVLSTFLQVQTQMFELLGVPLLGEEVGVLTMLKDSASLMGFLSYSHLPKGSGDRRIADLIRKCFVSACDIYTRCAANVGAISSFHDSIQAQSIQLLIEIISQISPTERGAHALVWVCFLAGAASTDEHQREFFVHRLEQVYARTHFRNIPTAIRNLRHIWTLSNGKRWTACLPQLSHVLAI